MTGVCEPLPRIRHRQSPLANAKGLCVVLAAFGGIGASPVEPVTALSVWYARRVSSTESYGAYWGASGETPPSA